MEMTCDLHTHSTYSDGTCTPRELIEEARAAGLGAIALTDHNTVDGLPSFMEAARDWDGEAIPGVEISTDYDGVELHLLGLYLPEESWSAVTAAMREANGRKEESNRHLVAALAGAGYELDYEAIRAKTPGGQVNRAHIAAALTEKGYTPSVQAAFATLVSKKGGFYEPPERISVFDAISLLRSLGAVTVLAHPLLNLSPEALGAFLPGAKERGLQAMETLYATYTPEQRALSHCLAEENGLRMSGGSDFHGTNKRDIHLGVGTGDLRVPADLAEKLRAAKKQGNFK